MPIADTTVLELLAGPPRVWGLMREIPADVTDDEGRQVVLQSGIAVWQEGILRQGWRQVRPPSCSLVESVQVDGIYLSQAIDPDAGIAMWLIKGEVNR